MLYNHAKIHTQAESERERGRHTHINTISTLQILRHMQPFLCVKKKKNHGIGSDKRRTYSTMQWIKKRYEEKNAVTSKRE